MYRIVVATVPARQAEFARIFAERGYRWDFAADDAEAADLILASPTDLLIVDLAVLGPRGPRIVPGVRRMKGFETLPVIAVIDAESAAEKLSQARTDDFLLEPLRGEELALRIESLLARRRGGGWNQLNFGEVVIDFDRYEVTRGGRRVDLTYKEHELLRFFASNPDKPFTREVLLDRVWGADYIGGVRTVDVHVRRLRAKIGDLRGRMIETVRGVGYRFRRDG